MKEQQNTTQTHKKQTQKKWRVIYNTLIENFQTLRSDSEEHYNYIEKTLRFQSKFDLNSSDQRLENLMIQLETRNIEQFKFLNWLGNFNSNKNLIGHWTPFWKGENICAGGYYNNQGIKVGFWYQLFEYYWDNAQIILHGIYNEGIKVQHWKIVYQNLIIGGGYYNYNSEKQGKWSEIDSNFYNLNNVRHMGEYRQGRKNGLWQSENNSQIIGLGLFDDNGMKNGKWIELSENFWNCSLLTQTGKYQNGRKVGIWQIEFKEQSDSDITVIGEGEYNQNGLKDGSWVDLHENFWNCCQVTYKGNYLNGKKIGKWKTIFQDNQVGSGTYNYQGIKTERWIELSENFQDNAQIFYQGDHYLGKKVGQWEIIYKENYSGMQKLRGGGDYDYKGEKQGFWEEPYFNFSDQCQITYVGQYQNSKRVGQWKINFRVNSKQQYISIGEGYYDQKGRKQGNWVELYEQFQNYNQIIFLGQYEKDNKIGKWDTSFRNQSDQEFRLMYYYDRILSGGGYFNQNKLKEGTWVELHQNFNSILPVVLVGIYKNGIKVGEWNYFYKEQQEINLHYCGGGTFDQNGIKIGKWNELHSNFGRFREVKMTGYYLKGKKQGLWKILYKDKQIAGGKYNQDGLKHGLWIELAEYFCESLQTIISMVYKNGIQQ